MTIANSLYAITAAAILGASMVAGAAAAQTESGAPKPVVAEDDNQMVCRREKETGSLVKSRKACHTRAQWRYLDEANQTAARRSVDDNRGTLNGSN